VLLVALTVLAGPVTAELDGIARSLYDPKPYIDAHTLGRVE